MIRKGTWAPLCAAAAVAAACGTADPVPVLITETGCVTGSQGEYILTALEPGVPHPGLEHEPAGTAPRPTVEAYRLVGADAELADLVGERAEVSGEADPSQLVEIREMSGPSAPREAGDTTARVDADAQIRVELHELDVLSMNATGDTCATAPVG